MYVCVLIWHLISLLEKFLLICHTNVITIKIIINECVLSTK